MSIQDDAFDIQHACKKKCPETAEHFIEWAWELEEERDRLLKDIKRLNTTILTILVMGKTFDD